MPDGSGSVPHVPHRRHDAAGLQERPGRLREPDRHVPGRASGANLPCGTSARPRASATSRRPSTTSRAGHDHQVLPGVYLEEPSLRRAHRRVRRPAGAAAAQTRLPGALLRAAGGMPATTRTSSRCWASRTCRSRAPAPSRRRRHRRSVPALNAIRADRANGIYLRNFTAQKTTFNAVYIMESDGFVIDTRSAAGTTSTGSSPSPTTTASTPTARRTATATRALPRRGVEHQRGPRARRRPVRHRDHATATSHHNLLGYSRYGRRLGVGARQPVHRQHRRSRRPTVGLPGPPRPAAEPRPFRAQRHRRQQPGLLPATSATAPAPKPSGRARLRAGRRLPGGRCATRHRRDQPGRQLQHLAGQLGLRQLLRRLRHLLGTGLHPQRHRICRPVRHVPPQPLLRQPPRLSPPDGEPAPNGMDFWWDGQGVGSCWQARAAGASRAPLPRCGADNLPGRPRYGPVRRRAGARCSSSTSARLRPGRPADPGATATGSAPAGWTGSRCSRRWSRRCSRWCAGGARVVAAAATGSAWASAGSRLSRSRAGRRRVRLRCRGDAADRYRPVRCSARAGSRSAGRCAARGAPGVRLAHRRARRCRPPRRGRPLAVDAALDPGTAVVAAHPAGARLAALGAWSS